MTRLDIVPSAEKAGRASGFDEWMAKVDGKLVVRVGLSSADLPDVAYAEMYEDGLSPAGAAARAIKNAREES